MNSLKALIKKYPVGFAVLIVLVLAVISGVNYVSEHSNQPQVQASDTPTTPPKPTPTPTLVRHITDIVTHHNSDDGFSTLWGVITGAEKTGNAYRVDVTLNASESQSEEDREIQQSVYVILDALYNNSDIHPDQVTVRVFGPVTDKYGNTSNGQWAVAVLTKRTEVKFNWSGLSYDSAWNVYDQAAYLVNGL